MRGNRPLVHVLPLLMEVGKPMSHEPPSKTRPTWKVATIVAPLEKVSGSTSVWWYVVLEAVHVAAVKGSLLIWVRLTFAKARVGSATINARARANDVTTRVRQPKRETTAMRDCSFARCLDPDLRSEERRVGKECRSRWSP